MSRPAIRPGRMIRKVLGKGPATTAEIHRAYREAIRVENGRRPRRDQLRPMTYESFRTYMTRARASGLIRIVGSKPMEKSPNPLIGVRGMRVIETQMQQVYELTPDGRGEISGWENIQTYAAGLEVPELKRKRRTAAPAAKEVETAKQAAKPAAKKAAPTKKGLVAAPKLDTKSEGYKISQRLKKATAPAAEKTTKKRTPPTKAPKG